MVKLHNFLNFTPTAQTDPENTDYTLENGATRLFEASKAYHKQEEQEKKDKEDEEANNPMKVLENRTKDSKLEMEVSLFSL